LIRSVFLAAETPTSRKARDVRHPACDSSAPQDGRQLEQACYWIVSAPVDCWLWLVAQAQALNVPILSADAVLDQYDVKRIW
jgi:hypothetical protein